MKLALLDRLLSLHRDGVPAAVATALDDGRQGLVTADMVFGDLPLDDEALAAVRRATEQARSGTIETPAGTVFVEVWALPPRLIVVGAVHLAQVLVPLARAVGYRVIVVDPRAAFATPERFPDVEIAIGWPDEVLVRLAPDRRTAVVTLSHDPKIDDPALLAALRSDACYVGALGSRRTHAGRRARLGAAGLGDTGPDEAALDRIHAPVGLAISAVTPAEIAVSIMAEIIQAFRRPRN